VQEAIVEQGHLTLTHVQADEIRVRSKKEIFWMGLAMEVSSRLWLAGIVCVAREQVLADRLMLRVRRCTAFASQLLICVDGWACYPAAILRAFSSQVNRRFRVWPQLIIGQVIKTQKHYHLESVKQALLCGEEKGLQTCLEHSRGGTQINTAFIERLNGTFRERLASLTRKCRHANRRLSAFEWGMYLIGCTYNLCWPHQELSKNKHLGFPSTPAMAAGLTNHAWSISEVLTYKITPQLLAKVKADQLQELAPPPPVPRLSKSVTGHPSPAYLALLRLKEQEAGLRSITT
jgi:hypothetical protein